MADNIKSIITALQNLTDEEKEALRSILGGEPSVEQTKKKGPPEHIKKKISTESQAGKKRRVVQIESEDDDEDETPSRSRSRRGKKQGVRGTVDGAPCRQEPVQKGKKDNVFPKMAEFKADRHLVKEDKEAWERQKGQMVPRIRAGYAEVKCKRCRDTFQVGKGLAHKNFICDDCITRE